MNIHFQPYLIALEEELRQVLAVPLHGLAPLYHMMAYHLGWLDEHFQPLQGSTGKRIRPLLCLLACEAAGGDWHNALPAAAAVELVHNFSLIHDDIEDNSTTRRGRTTLWALWGLAQGINVGDAMYTLAHQALTRLRDRGTEPPLILAAVEILDKACLELCHGQYLDLAYESHLEVTEEAYLQMIGGKTAALLAASTQLGALIAEAGEQTEHYRLFGWYLGLAFQMVDDILGIWGDPATTGKSAADDIRNRKITLPILFALRSEVGEALAALYRQETLSDADIQRAVALLDRAGARDYVQERAAFYEARALAALDAARAREPVASALRDLATSLTSRQK
ncbi:MAG: polyprenyl synthetase family protein [Chloroflexi bacterium]|nr:polyprenyl synthetase family protein [Chloroflexota bacterium]